LRAEVPTGRFELLSLDLADLDSVRTCARQFNERGLALSLLVNNAGVAGKRGLTKSGFELAFGINHVGHFLLTQLLLPRIRQAVPARIVTVASHAHRVAHGIDYDAVRQRTRTRFAYHEYAVSKLANILFSSELARRLDGSGVTSYALHPGVVASDVWREVPWPFRSLAKLAMLSVDRGAETSLHCALAPEAAVESGNYYDCARICQPSRTAQDVRLAAELWERSETWAAP
jgi:NAD(P)-dependent dehydrogenase (short-subunit alcohol dehydrogenase family)